MQPVWVVGLPAQTKRKSIRGLRAELHYVTSIKELESTVSDSERLIVITAGEDAEKIRTRFGSQILALRTLPDGDPDDLLPSVVEIALRDAQTMHDMEAAEAVAWTGVQGGAFDDPFLEHLGESVLEIVASPDLSSVERALLHACKRLVPVEKVRLVPYPDYLNARELGDYRLAVPIEFGGELKAHIYVKFQKNPKQAEVENLGEAVLGLSDAVALSVDRARMLKEAERNRAIWEASFDAVGDPLAILDENMKPVRTNRAYQHLFGRKAEIPGLSVREPGEWEWTFNKQVFRAFLDMIPEATSQRKYVLRLRDISEERSLTEKLLAKESVSEMGILVSSIAHEVANPIGGILATGQVLLKELPEGSEEREDVASITEAAERAARIVQTMLSLARKSDEGRKDISLRECLSMAMDLLAPEAKRLGVKLEIAENLAESVLLNVNKTRLMQVFFHLFQQSLHAISERKKVHPAKRWFCRAELSQGNGAALCILDNGDPIIHQYETQSSVAFAVSRMILEEWGATLAYGFGPEGENCLTLKFPPDIVS